MKVTRNKIRSLIREALPDINLDTGLSSREIYALISIPFEGATVISGYSIEELKREAAFFPGAEITAIFYAEIIEGEL